MQLYKKTSVEDIQIKLIRAKDSTLQKLSEKNNTSNVVQSFPPKNLFLKILHEKNLKR